MITKEIVMSNLMVTKGRYQLTKEEQNFIYLMISQINKNDNEFKEYQIHIKDLENAELTQKQYARYKEFAKILMTKIIIIENEKSILTSNWFSSIEYIKNTGYIKATISSKLKPYLLELKEEFVKAKLPVLLSFKSKYSSRLYLYLKSIYGFATAKTNLSKVIKNIEVDYLIKQFEMPKSYSQVYSKFKNIFLLKSLEEINEKTEFNIEYKQLKTGRKITSIQFCISKLEQSLDDVVKNLMKTKTKSDYIPQNLSNKAKEVLLDEEVALTISDLKKIFDHYCIEDIEQICEELWSIWDSKKLMSHQAFFRGKLKHLNRKKIENQNICFGFDELFDTENN